jgi:hypothetical protein
MPSCVAKQVTRPSSQMATDAGIYLLDEPTSGMHGSCGVRRDAADAEAGRPDRRCRLPGTGGNVS